MATLNLMLIDDHLLVRAGFKRLLMTFEDVAVVAEASSGEEALNLYKLHQPDIVILEIEFLVVIQIVYVVIKFHNMLFNYFDNVSKNKKEIKRNMKRNRCNHKPSIHKLYIFILYIVRK
jgi:response regulator RpfG family c-di-GMP phosphodiesterase